MSTDLQQPGETRAESDPQTDAAPVGTGDCVVRQGDCISSIAKEKGHFWETIWNDAANADLKRARQSPNVLLPGDRVHVSALRQKSETGQTELRHRFRRKGQPEIFRLCVLRDGKPRANQPYALDVDGELHDGTTDAEGNLECPIPPNARRVKVTVGAEPDIQEHEFSLGEIDPVDAISGVQGRLRNLGFDCGPIDGVWGPRTERAVRKFQAHYDLPETGEADEATRARLKREYGC